VGRDFYTELRGLPLEGRGGALFGGCGGGGGAEFPAYFNVRSETLKFHTKTETGANSQTLDASPKEGKHVMKIWTKKAKLWTRVKGQ
jgi:hypothetical protein